MVVFCLSLLGLAAAARENVSEECMTRCGQALLTVAAAGRYAGERERCMGQIMKEGRME